MIITCCKGCERRHIGCHSECEDYKSQKKAFERQKEKRTLTIALETRLNGVMDKRKK